jgi:hypothetical protein
MALVISFKINCFTRRDIYIYQNKKLYNRRSYKSTIISC